MSMNFRPKTYEIFVQIGLSTDLIQLTYGSTGQSITYIPVGFSFEAAPNTATHFTTSDISLV